MIAWRGVFPAVTTQMDLSGRIDTKGIYVTVSRLIDDGISGLVMLGMVGENSVLQPDEKMLVLQAALDASKGKVPVLSGLAELNTENACRYAERAQAMGVQGLMVFPPLGYSTGAKETVDFYSSVARASKLEILIYNNPSAYGVDVTPVILQQLTDQKTIVAIKEETYDPRRVTDIINATGDRFAIMCGVDDLVFESVALGAVGWVSGMANAYPAESAEIVELISRGEWEQARILYRIMTPIYHFDTEVKLVQFIKLAAEMNGIGTAHVRKPRLALDGEERAALERTVRVTREELKGYRSQFKSSLSA
jgi:4-hydroxy-tetrahydrodipicolinate synthase